MEKVRLNLGYLDRACILSFHQDSPPNKIYSTCPQTTSKAQVNTENETRI